jgi:hypothetical protein
MVLTPILKLSRAPTTMPQKAHHSGRYSPWEGIKCFIGYSSLARRSGIPNGRFGIDHILLGSIVPDNRTVRGFIESVGSECVEVEGGGVFYTFLHDRELREEEVVYRGWRWNVRLHGAFSFHPNN